MTTSRLMMAAMAGCFVAGSASATLLGTYEFTAGSLVATDADPGDGITLSDFNLNNYTLAGLTDEGGDGDSLRITGTDDPGGTGSAFANGLFLSFTVTNNSGQTLNFGSIDLDFVATNIFSQQQARVYTDQQGFDDIVPDTIGRLGPSASGDSAGSDTVLLDGTDPENGANTVGDAIVLADGASQTFYLPFNQNSSSATRFTDYDNISISSSVVSIPGDADGDGDIDDTDLGISISNFTGPVGAEGGKTAADGDTDGDGDVDDTDLGVSISGFTGPLAPTAVPEPTSLALLTLGGLLVARRRRA